MKTITINASKTYDVSIGAGILEKAGTIIRKTTGGEKAVIISDDKVFSLYGEKLVDSLEENGYRVSRYIFPNGEASKNTGTFLSILNFLADSKLSRTDVIAALGGGVVGDLAGFAASVYLRGVRFAQIPTTLLAAVDSSVGGKTAVNLAAGKNLAGAFYQPDTVICDVSLMSTLTPENFTGGCSEIIKYGVICDRALFNSLATPVQRQLEDVIARCVIIKRDIVSEDEFDKNRRKLLNFGHTIGHAVELLNNYRITHGHAVAIGMAVVTRAAVGMGICEGNCLDALLQMLRLYGLPEKTEYEADTLARVCLTDKKREGEYITMVFPEKIGKCILKEIKTNELEAVIKSGLGN